MPRAIVFAAFGVSSGPMRHNARIYIVGATPDYINDVTSRSQQSVQSHAKQPDGLAEFSNSSKLVPLNPVQSRTSQHLFLSVLRSIRLPGKPVKHAISSYNTEAMHRRHAVKLSRGYRVVSMSAINICGATTLANHCAAVVAEAGA